eukprot:scaffold32088_cov16-Tisochrysis_lutea.AAC.1
MAGIMWVCPIQYYSSLSLPLPPPDPMLLGLRKWTSESVRVHTHTHTHAPLATLLRCPEGAAGLQQLDRAIQRTGECVLEGESGFVHVTMNLMPLLPLWWLRVDMIAHTLLPICSFDVGILGLQHARSGQGSPRGRSCHLPALCHTSVAYLLEGQPTYGSPACGTLTGAMEGQLTYGTNLWGT